MSKTEQTETITFYSDTTDNYGAVVKALEEFKSKGFKTTRRSVTYSKPRPAVIMRVLRKHGVDATYSVDRWLP
jgi:uncharacterized linocin/CFP29 family protein